MLSSITPSLTLISHHWNTLFIGFLIMQVRGWEQNMLSCDNCSCFLHFLFWNKDGRVFLKDLSLFLKVQSVLVKDLSLFETLWSFSVLWSIYAYATQYSEFVPNAEYYTLVGNPKFNIYDGKFLGEDYNTLNTPLTAIDYSSRHTGLSL